MADLRRLITELTSLSGVSGSEQDVVRYLVDVLSPLADTCVVDNWGNIVATRGSQNDDFTLLIGAHSDEIGFYVKAIDNQGFLRVEAVGGVPKPLMPGRPVTVGGVPGVIGWPAWHLGKQVDPNRLYIDIGAESQEDALAMGVSVGSPVTLDTEARALGPHRVSAKAMDNRIACVVLVGLFEALRGQDLNVTFTGVVTVQEEVGLRGAHMVAGRIPASAAISVDIMTTGDTPDCDGLTDSTVRLGGGPVISVFDQIEEAFAASLIGIVGHPRLNAMLFQIAEQTGIPLQPCVLTGGGADAAAFHLARGGVPATQISVPARYSHSMVETVDLRDVDATVSLLSHFVSGLPPDPDLSFV